MAAAQALVHLRGQAVLVAEPDHQPLGGGAQKHLQRGQVLHHRQAQVMAREFDFGALGTKSQVRAPEQAVIAEGQAFMAKVRPVDGDASPG
ncbi:hypothetical protein D3C73_1294590 [compost metagenome]